MDNPDGPRSSDSAGLPALNGNMAGCTEIGDELGALAGRYISRQCVWQWWYRRDRTGFPEGELTATGRKFSKQEVILWWEGYRHRVRWLPGRLVYTRGTCGIVSMRS